MTEKWNGFCCKIPMSVCGCNGATCDICFFNRRCCFCTKRAVEKWCEDHCENYQVCKDCKHLWTPFNYLDE